MAKAVNMNLELHPLSSLFPRMTGTEFASLRDDIAANGLRSPIVLHDGMILDGGNRYRACIEAGVEPAFTAFDGDNIVSFVLSANLHRRHMTAGQQAAIVSSAQDWAKAQRHGGDRKSDQGEGLHLETSKQRAAVSGATVRTQKDADKLAREHPEKAKEVAQGKTSLYKAVKETKQEKPKTQAEQAEEQRLQDAFGDGDPLELLEQLQADNERMVGELQAAEADDLKAEALKWRRIADQAQRRQSELMQTVADREKELQRQSRTIMRICKAVGEEDPSKLAAAVEAMARNAARAAA